MRLLLVEDEALIAMDLEQLAISLGHQVVGIADTLRSAVETAAAEAPDAALVDLNLRDGMTGKEVARTLSAKFGFPVGFVTGNAEQLAGDFAGARAVVDKPFNDFGLQEILLILEAACAGTPPPKRLKFARLAA